MGVLLGTVATVGNHDLQCLPFPYCVTLRDLEELMTEPACAWTIPPLAAGPYDMRRNCTSAFAGNSVNPIGPGVSMKAVLHMRLKEQSAAPSR